MYICGFYFCFRFYSLSLILFTFYSESYSIIFTLTAINAVNNRTFGRGKSRYPVVNPRFERALIGTLTFGKVYRYLPSFPFHLFCEHGFFFFFGT